jgi:hypothetical protein
VKSGGARGGAAPGRCRLGEGGGAAVAAGTGALASGGAEAPAALVRVLTPLRVRREGAAVRDARDAVDRER